MQNGTWRKSGNGPSQLEVQCREYRGHMVLSPRGALDLLTVREFAQDLWSILDQCRGADRGVILELDELTLLSSAGLTTLSEAHRWSRDHGLRLAIVAGHDFVRMPLVVTGLDHAFDVYDNVEDAVVSPAN